MTNHEVDPILIREAAQISQCRKKRVVAQAVFKKYIQRCRQVELLDLFGHVEYDKDYDYKEQRRQK